MAPKRSAAQLAQPALPLASSARSGGAPPPAAATREERINSLMDEIRRLGHQPRRHGEHCRDEHKLGNRLENAKRYRHLSRAQLREIAALPRPQTARSLAVEERTNTLMDDIRRLGHLPRSSRKLGHEYTVAIRLREARRGGHLTEAQLEELENTPRYKRPATSAPYKERIATLMTAIRELGHLPRDNPGLGEHEFSLAISLAYARKRRQLLSLIHI